MQHRRCVPTISFLYAVHLLLHSECRQGTGLFDAREHQMQDRRELPVESWSIQ